MPPSAATKTPPSPSSAWATLAGVDAHDRISGRLVSRLLRSRSIETRVPEGMGDFDYEVPADRLSEAIGLLKSVPDLYRHLKWTSDRGNNPSWPPRENVRTILVGKPYRVALESESFSPTSAAGRALRDDQVADRIRRGASDFVKSVEIEERDFRTETMEPVVAHAAIVRLEPPGGEVEEIERLFGRVYVEVYPEERSK